jgi:hypothetical protein
MPPLRAIFNTAILAHRCRRGPSAPSVAEIWLSSELQVIGLGDELGEIDLKRRQSNRRSDKSSNQASPVMSCSDAERAS